MNLCRNNLKTSNQYYKRKSFTQQAYVTDKRISYICGMKCFLTCVMKNKLQLSISSRMYTRRVLQMAWCVLSTTLHKMSLAVEGDCISEYGLCSLGCNVPTLHSTHVQDAPCTLLASARGVMTVLIYYTAFIITSL